MLITEERFEEYKKNKGEEDCLIYGESVNGDFTSSMCGDDQQLKGAILTLIRGYCHHTGIDYKRFADEMVAVLSMADILRSDEEGGER